MEVEIDRFIGDTLTEYVEKVMVPRPMWELVDPLEKPERVVTHLGVAFASYHPREERMYFNEYTLSWAWKKDPEKAKRFARFLVAEEYWHHVQKKRGVIFFDKFYRARPIVEWEAKKQAEFLSGISQAEMRDLVRYLFGLRGPLAWGYLRGSFGS